MNIRSFNVILIFLLYLFQLSTINNDNEIGNGHNMSAVSSSILFHETLSLREMVSIRGGCGGGGTCTDTTPSCASGCTALDISKCSGSSGSCVTNITWVSCKCSYGLVFTSGCQ